MNELQAIIQACDGLQADDSSAVLATVVRVKGSAYRRPGARMLLLPGGGTVGTVSGGCLEGDVKLQAWRLLEAGRPVVLRYDSTADGEVVWQLGMGCKGIVDVLLERVGPGVMRESGPLGFLRRLTVQRGTGVLARVLACEGGTGAEIGAFWGVDDQNVVLHDIRCPELTAFVERDAADVLSCGLSREAAYAWNGGRAEVFLELIRPPLTLLVCGAGHDAQPLVRMAKELGWNVTVFDHRPGYATTARFPMADRVLVGDARDVVLSAAGGGVLRAAVVMSHQYHTDLDYLRSLLPQPLEYLGMLGPRNRTESLLRDLAREGFNPTPGQRERLFAPVGLDIGAETPEGIALSVLAEVQAVLSGRDGGSLRGTDRPIHGRATEQSFPTLTIVAQAPAACAEGATR